MNGGRNHYLVFRDNVRCWCVYMGTYSSRKKSWFFQNCYFSTKQQNNWSFVDIWKRLFTHGDGVCCVCTTPASVSGSEAESSSGPVVGERGQEDTVLTRGWHWDSSWPSLSFLRWPHRQWPVLCPGSSHPDTFLGEADYIITPSQEHQVVPPSDWLIDITGLRHRDIVTLWGVTSVTECDRVWQVSHAEADVIKCPLVGVWAVAAPTTQDTEVGLRCQPIRSQCQVTWSVPANQRPVSGQVISPSQSEGESKWPSGGSFKRIIGVLRRNSGEKEKFCSFRDV